MDHGAKNYTNEIVLVMLELVADLSVLVEKLYRDGDDLKHSWLSGNGLSGNFGISISPSSIFKASVMVGLRATMT